MVGETKWKSPVDWGNKAREEESLPQGPGKFASRAQPGSLDPRSLAAEVLSDSSIRHFGFQVLILCSTLC